MGREQKSSLNKMGNHSTTGVNAFACMQTQFHADGKHLDGDHVSQGHDNLVSALPSKRMKPRLLHTWSQTTRPYSLDRSLAGNNLAAREKNRDISEDYGPLPTLLASNRQVEIKRLKSWYGDH